MLELYTKAASVAVPLVENVADEQLDGPTPCSEFTVRDLLNHLFHVAVEFQKAARREEMNFANAPDYLTGDWRKRFSAEVDALAQAWSQPGAVEGENSQMGFPRAVVARMPVFDLTIHGWDLARATGQQFSADSGLVDEIYAMTLQLAEKGRSVEQFGTPVDVSADAPTVDKLVGMVGRNPAWTP